MRLGKIAYCLRKRMLCLLLNSYRPSQCLLLRNILKQLKIGERGLAYRQGTGLIENHGINLLPRRCRP